MEWNYANIAIWSLVLIFHLVRMIKGSWDVWTWIWILIALFNIFRSYSVLKKNR